MNVMKHTFGMHGIQSKWFWFCLSPILLPIQSIEEK